MTIGTLSFGATAERYRAAGWAGTLLLPPDAKYPPPAGFTGEAGTFPTDDDVAAWDAAAAARGGYNFALRLPADVIGIDVDAYGDKAGAATLADAEARWGNLPATWTSTARDDGVSGIRLFTVPEGLAWPNVVGPGIEVVRHGHRYTVAAPSIHPTTGTPYRWTGPDGTAADVAPRDGLPQLPAAWVDGLTGGAAAEPPHGRADVDVDAWLRDLPGDDPCLDVVDALDRGRLALSGGGSRYDAMRDATFALVTRGHAGCPGVAGALFDLHAAYDEATAGEQRDPGEWNRSLHGAIARVVAVPSAPEDECSVDLGRRLGFRGPRRQEVDLWDERPILRHLHDFARGRRVAPTAVLGAALARIVAATPSNIVLPPTIGADGSLNIFIAFVGASGAGKGSAEAAATDAIDLSRMLDKVSGEPLRPVNVGSGEGFLHQLVTRRQGELHRLRDSVLFSVPEVDTLAALGARQGATLMPVLRSAYSGEALSFAYADPAKALHVDARDYRCALLLGVQPTKAGPLLDDADGGTPQRFVWLPVTDPDMPRERSAPPAPVVWDRTWPSTRYEMPVCAAAVDAIDEAVWRRSRGEGDPLDGHALYTRLKVAAALALLDRRLNVTDDDWRIAGRVMVLSDNTRRDVVASLRARVRDANIGRAEAEAARAVVIEEAKDAHTVRRAVNAIRAVLERRPGEWVTASELRRALPSRVRPQMSDALEALEVAGTVEVEAIDYHGTPGKRYRSTTGPEF